MKKKIMIIALIVLVIAGGIGMFSLLDNMKYRNDTMDVCSISSGGGMLGGSSSVRLERKGDKTTLTVSRRETHADREVTTTYQVSADAFEQLAKLVNRYDLYAASKRPYSQFQALDGETTTYYFGYSNGSFSISSEYVLSRKMREGLREVDKYLSSISKGEGITEIEPQQIRLYLTGYNLFFTVEDSFDGRLDELLIKKDPISRADDYGIVIATGELDVTGEQGVTGVAAGTIIYDEKTSQMIIMYDGHEFDHEVYLLAEIDNHTASAYQLIKEMTDDYYFSIN